MNLTQLEYFYKVANSPTLTRAAAELHVSQPAVSKTIRDLEREFQTQFFLRSGRKMLLTPEGEILLKHTAHILSSLDALRSELRDAHARQDMTLRIGVFAASALFPGLISNFSKAHPHINIQLIMHSDYDRDKERSLDMALSAGWEPPRSSRSLILIREHIKLSLPSGHPLSHRDSVTLRELEGVPFISLSRGKSLRTVMDHYCKQAGLVPNIVLESDDPYMLRNLVSCGFGAAFVPEVTWQHQPKGPLVFLNDGTPCVRYLYCDLPAGDYTTTAARLFLTYLRGYFRTLSQGTSPL